MELNLRAARWTNRPLNNLISTTWFRKFWRALAHNCKLSSEAMRADKISLKRSQADVVVAEVCDQKKKKNTIESMVSVTTDQLKPRRTGQQTGPRHLAAALLADCLPCSKRFDQTDRRSPRARHVRDRPDGRGFVYVYSREQVESSRFSQSVRQAGSSAVASHGAKMVGRSSHARSRRPVRANTKLYEKLPLKWRQATRNIMVRAVLHAWLLLLKD
jgi:hypothetical protein